MGYLSLWAAAPKGPAKAGCVAGATEPSRGPACVLTPETSNVTPLAGVIKLSFCNEITLDYVSGPHIQ